MKTLLLFAVTLGLITSAKADLIFMDDFSGFSANQEINYNSGTGSTWKQKWDGNDATQRNLIKATGTGGATLDTSIAVRNYHALAQTAFSISAGETAVVSSDFQYTHGAGVAANVNKNFFGLLVSTTPDWWSGTNKAMSVANRGAAIGNLLPVAPWTENWVLHANLGVDTLTGGTSDWLNASMNLSINASGNYEGILEITKVADDSSVFTSSPVDLGLVAGTSLYAGYTTDWNNSPDSIASVNNITSLGLNNFSISVTAVPEPSSLALVGLAGGLMAVRRRKRSV
ncbi:MAG: PEP-CTERM sorting domain-containing protein [Rubripirellula sp.]